MRRVFSSVLICWVAGSLSLLSIVALSAQPSVNVEVFDALPGKFGYQAGGWQVDKHVRLLGDVNGDGRGVGSAGWPVRRAGRRPGGQVRL